MFCKDNKSVKLLGQCKDKSGVIHEALYWSFTASEEEHRTRAIPVSIYSTKHGTKEQSLAYLDVYFNI